MLVFECMPITKTIHGRGLVFGLLGFCTKHYVQHTIQVNFSASYVCFEAEVSFRQTQLYKI